MKMSLHMIKSIFENPRKFSSSISIEFNHGEREREETHNLGIVNAYHQASISWLHVQKLALGSWHVISWSIRNCRNSRTILYKLQKKTIAKGKDQCEKHFTISTAFGNYPVYTMCWGNHQSSSRANIGNGSSIRTPTCDMKETFKDQRCAQK